MAKEVDGTFQEVFCQTSSTGLVKLLPWYVSTAVPLCYEQSTGHCCTTERGCPHDYHCTRSEGSQALASSDSPTHQSGTPPLPVSPMLDIPFVGTIPVGHPLTGFIVCPPTQSGATVPAAHLVSNATSGPVLTPKRSMLEANTALQRGIRTDPKWHWRLCQAPTCRGGNQPVPPPVLPRPPLILMMVQWWKPQGVPGIRTVRAMPITVGSHLTWMCPERTWATQIWSQPLGNVSLVQTWRR